jgi:hypothetical protein
MSGFPAIINAHLQLAGVLAVVRQNPRLCRTRSDISSFQLACPGGPVISAFVGRHAPLNIAPTALLPNPADPVTVLLARFADMGFSSRELMALVGAHSTGKQRFVDTAQANSTFDSTIDIWDTRFCKPTARGREHSTLIPAHFRYPDCGHHRFAW